MIARNVLIFAHHPIIVVTLCARFRDIGSAIVSGLQFVFFFTPVIWTEDSVRGTAFAWLTRANPFATLRRADEMKAVA